MPRESQPAAKKRKGQSGSKRTFTIVQGCWSCRSRGVKCDEKLPGCSQCERHGKKCAGYRQNLVWVESSDHKKYTAGGRRLLELETWENFPAFDTCDLDEIIAECEFDPEDSSKSFVLCPPFGVFRSSDVFSEGVIENAETPEVAEESSSSITDKADFVDDSGGKKDLRLIRNPRYENRIKVQDVHIFHHYIRDVAPALMPYDDPRNPWSSYPALALYYSGEGRKYLFHALMAHSAIALANRGYDTVNMMAKSVKYCILAMEELRAVITDSSTDYVSSLTTIMTLMFTEMYHGHSTTWRPHLNGGWQFMLQKKENRMWNLSEQAWYATQSFCLIRIMSDTIPIRSTNLLLATLSSNTEDSIMESLLSSDLFGITLGASSSLMRCISDINRLSRTRKAQTFDLPTAKAAADILQRLEMCRSSDLLLLRTDDDNRQIVRREQTVGQFHLRAFIAAAFIYFYQSFYDTPPSSLEEFVSEVLHNLMMFVAAGGVNFTFWPAFIAAAEVYRDEDKAIVEQIFASAGASCLQNRANIKALVVEVWRLRETRAAESGLEIGMVKVDWKLVMQDLELDILLM